MATTFLEQIPPQFRQDRITLQFVQNLYIRVNETLLDLQTTAQELALAQDLVEDLQQELANQGEPQEQFIEQPLSAFGTVEAQSGFFYFTTEPQGNSPLVYNATLPEFPEQDFYVRFQVFNNHQLSVTVPNNRLPIQASNELVISGNGDVVDIRYSLEIDGYVLT